MDSPIESEEKDNQTFRLNRLTMQRLTNEIKSIQQMFNVPNSGSNDIELELNDEAIDCNAKSLIKSLKTNHDKIRDGVTAFRTELADKNKLVSMMRSENAKQQKLRDEEMERWNEQSMAMTKLKKENEALRNEMIEVENRHAQITESKRKSVKMQMHSMENTNFAILRRKSEECVALKDEMKKLVFSQKAHQERLKEFEAKFDNICRERDGLLKRIKIMQTEINKEAELIHLEKAEIKEEQRIIVKQKEEIVGLKEKINQMEVDQFTEWSLYNTHSNDVSIVYTPTDSGADNEKMKDLTQRNGELKELTDHLQHQMECMQQYYKDELAKNDNKSCKISDALCAMEKIVSKLESKKGQKNIQSLVDNIKKMHSYDGDNGVDIGVLMNYCFEYVNDKESNVSVDALKERLAELQMKTNKEKLPRKSQFDEQMDKLKRRLNVDNLDSEQAKNSKKVFFKPMSDTTQSMATEQHEQHSMTEIELKKAFRDRMKDLKIKLMQFRQIKNEDEDEDEVEKEKRESENIDLEILEAELDFAHLSRQTKGETIEELKETIEELKNTLTNTIKMHEKNDKAMQDTLNKFCLQRDEYIVVNAAHTETEKAQTMQISQLQTDNGKQNDAIAGLKNQILEMQRKENMENNEHVNAFNDVFAERDGLSKKVETLKGIINKGAKIHKTEIVKLQTNNQQQNEEINSLRTLHKNQIEIIGVLQKKLQKYEITKVENAEKNANSDESMRDGKDAILEIDHLRHSLEALEKKGFEHEKKLMLENNSLKRELSKMKEENEQIRQRLAGDEDSEMHRMERNDKRQSAVIDGLKNQIQRLLTTDDAKLNDNANMTMYSLRVENAYYLEQIRQKDEEIKETKQLFQKLIEAKNENSMKITGTVQTPDQNDIDLVTLQKQLAVKDKMIKDKDCEIEYIKNLNHDRIREIELMTETMNKRRESHSEKIAEITKFYESKLSAGKSFNEAYCKEINRLNECIFKATRSSTSSSSSTENESDDALSKTISDEVERAQKRQSSINIMELETTKEHYLQQIDDLKKQVADGKHTIENLQYSLEKAQSLNQELSILIDGYDENMKEKENEIANQCKIINDMAKNGRRISMEIKEMKEEDDDIEQCKQRITELEQLESEHIEQIVEMEQKVLNAEKEKENLSHVIEEYDKVLKKKSIQLKKSLIRVSQISDDGINAISNEPMSHLSGSAEPMIPICELTPMNSEELIPNDFNSKMHDKEETIKRLRESLMKMKQLHINSELREKLEVPKDAIIKDLRGALKKTREESLKITKKLAMSKTDIAQAENLKNIVKTQEHDIALQEKVHRQLIKIINKLRSQKMIDIKDRSAEFKTSDDESKDLVAKYEELKLLLDAYDQNIKDKDAQIKILTQTNQDFREEILDKNNEIKKLEFELTESGIRQIDEVTAKLTAKEKIIKDLQQQILEKDKKLTFCEQLNEEEMEIEDAMQNEIFQRTQKVVEMEQMIVDLKRANSILFDQIHKFEEEQQQSSKSPNVEMQKMSQILMNDQKAVKNLLSQIKKKTKDNEELLALINEYEDDVVEQGKDISELKRKLHFVEEEKKESDLKYEREKEQHEICHEILERSQSASPGSVVSQNESIHNHAFVKKQVMEKSASVLSGEYNENEAMEILYLRRMNEDKTRHITELKESLIDLRKKVDVQSKSIHDFEEKIEKKSKEMNEYEHIVKVLNIKERDAQSIISQKRDVIRGLEAELCDKVRLDERKSKRQNPALLDEAKHEIRILKNEIRDADDVIVELRRSSGKNIVSLNDECVEKLADKLDGIERDVDDLKVKLNEFGKTMDGYEQYAVEGDKLRKENEKLRQRTFKYKNMKRLVDRNHALNEVMNIVQNKFDFS